MRRPTRYCPVDVPAHLIQRGNNRCLCFLSNYDFATYISCLSAGADKYRVDVHAWVLMPNHVHILATPREPGAISSMMQYLGRHYVRYFNKRHDRTGTLWEGRFRSCLVQGNKYLLNCQKYIELNPVRAGMVTNPADYRWSSFHRHAHGKSGSLARPHPVYLALGSSSRERCAVYRQLINCQLQAADIKEIRQALNKGLVFGSERFKAQIENISGLAARSLKPGPKGAAHG